MKNVVFILLTSIFISSCVKEDKGSIVPESCPYMAQPFEKIEERIEKLMFAITYDSLTKSDNIDLTRVYYNDSLQTGLIKAINFTSFNAFGISPDQNTIKTDSSKSINDICPLPYKFDGNKNGSLDVSFLLSKKDSIVYQIHDHNISSNIPYYRVSFGLDDGYYIIFQTYWYNTRLKEHFIILKKSNRLFEKKEKSPDTLIFINVSRERVEARVPAGFNCHYGWFIYQADSILVLYSDASKNHRKHNGFDDFHCYLIAYRENGEIIWADTLSDARREPAHELFQPYHFTDEFITGKSHLDENNEVKQMIVVYDKATGIIKRHKYIKNKILGSMFQFLENGRKRYIYMSEHNTLNKLDENFNLIKSEEFPVHLGQINYQEEIKSLVSRSYYNRYFVADVNGNGSTDILLTTLNDQLLVVDSETLEILLVTKEIKEEFLFSIVRYNYTTPKLAIIHGRSYELYNIIPTPFLTRLKPHFITIIIIFAGFFLLPVGYLAIYRIAYLAKLFQMLGSRSESQGVIVLRKSRIRKMPKIIRLNKKATELLQLTMKLPERKSLNYFSFLKNKILRLSGVNYKFSDFPSELQEIQLKQTAIKSGKSYNIVLGGAEQRYLSLVFARMKVLGSGNTSVITIIDSSAIVKQELYSLAISIVHNAKNQLAEIHSRMENMMFKAKETITGDTQWFDESESKLHDSIQDVADTLKKLLYASNLPSAAMRETSLRDFIGEWISEKGGRYSRWDIELINKVAESLPKILLDEYHFGILIQCACDNAMQAMTKEQNEKSITFSSEQLEKGFSFIIRDNGSGMSPEYLEDIADSSFTSKPGGTGLGMRIIRRIADKHEAKFNISSIEGKGTKLIFTFKTIN